MLRTLPVWQQNHLLDCFDKQLIQNSHVLEIGGYTPEDKAEYLQTKSWTCIDPIFEKDLEVNERHKLIKKSVLDLDGYDGKFDFIIATNSFEHIDDLDKCLDKMYNLLAPNGKLSALLGPIWSSYKGHHIWVLNGEKTITYNDSKIPDWGHLLYSPEELREIINPYYTKDICTEIIRQVYDWDFLNRLFYDDYLEIINKSKFKIEEFRNWHTSKFPDKDTQKILEKKYNKKNFSTVSIKMILSK